MDKEKGLEKEEKDERKMGSGVGEVTPARDPTLLSAVKNVGDGNGIDRGKETV
jgi:hypothetical protein